MVEVNWPSSSPVSPTPLEHFLWGLSSARRRASSQVLQDEGAPGIRPCMISRAPPCLGKPRRGANSSRCVGSIVQSSGSSPGGSMRGSFGGREEKTGPWWWKILGRAEQ
jgi:hypothetical protein